MVERETQIRVYVSGQSTLIEPTVELLTVTTKIRGPTIVETQSSALEFKDPSPRRNANVVHDLSQRWSEILAHSLKIGIGLIEKFLLQNVEPG